MHNPLLQSDQLRSFRGTLRALLGIATLFALPVLVVGAQTVPRPSGVEEETIPIPTDVGELSAQAHGRLVLAATQGDVDAQIELAVRYILGAGLEKNYGEGLRWIEKAAHQGSTPARAVLGEMYLRGWSVDQSYVEAVTWLRLAAEQGHIGAQSRLGRLYFTGQGVAQDWKEAIKWLQAPADDGDAEAQLALGSAYVLSGPEFRRDYLIEGHKWINIAASRLTGERQAAAVAARDGLTKLMSRAELSEAQLRGRQWQERFGR
jgi:hypothetical protein